MPVTGRISPDRINDPTKIGRPKLSEIVAGSISMNENVGRFFLRAQDILAQYAGQLRDIVRDLPTTERTGSTTLKLGLKALPVQRILEPRTIHLLACYEGTSFWISNESGGSVPVLASDGAGSPATLAIRTLVDGEAMLVTRKTGFSSGSIPKWRVAVSNRPTEAEVQGLAADLTTLTGAISAEATARASADTTLTTAISSEATTRASADTTLATAISTETTDRIAAVGAEAASRAAGDALNVAKASNLSDLASPHAGFDTICVHGADIAAAATLDLDAATGSLIDVTGNTGITAITLSNGRRRIVRFTGTPTITHNASTLILPGGINITAAAGDIAVFVGYAAGVVRCQSFQPLAGLAPIDAQYVTLATNAKLSSERVLTPGSHTTLSDGGGGGAVVVDWLFNVRRLAQFYTDGASLGGFASQQSGTGSATTPNQASLSDDAHPGVTESAVGTTTSGRAAACFLTGTTIRFGTYAWRSWGALQLPTLSDGTDTFTHYAGFTDVLTGDATDGAYFRYTHGTNGGRWQTVTRSNSSETANDSGVAASAGTWVFLRIEVNAAGTQVLFYIDGSLVATHTTNIPTGSSRITGHAYSTVKSAGTNSRSHYSNVCLVEGVISR